MEFTNVILWVVGSLVALLTFAGLQRKYFPQTTIDGFMDLDKLKEICPEVCQQKEDKKP